MIVMSSCCGAVPANAATLAASTCACSIDETPPRAGPTPPAVFAELRARGIHRLRHAIGVKDQETRRLPGSRQGYVCVCETGNARRPRMLAHFWGVMRAANGITA